MRDRSADHDADRRLTDGDQIDLLGDEFEREYRAGAAPQVEAFLERVEVRLHEPLLRELISVEWELTAKSGSTPILSDWLTRFPDHELLLTGLHREQFFTETPRQPANPEQSTLIVPASSEAQPEPDVTRTFPVEFGDFELLAELGRGGMGVVFRARDRHLPDREVALKVLRAGVLADASEIERFRREAAVTAQLDHSGIVPVYAVGEYDGQQYFTMPIIAGTTLDERLQQAPLCPREAAMILLQTAEAVSCAHEKHIIHRDLKPANILLEESGRVRVADFGLARSLRDAMKHTGTGQILGTPAFMSPEQAAGDRDQLSPASDVYALGGTLHAALTGQAPLAGISLAELLQRVQTDEPLPVRKIRPEVPRDLETICLKCLRKKPVERYRNAQALADDLRRFLNDEPIQARPRGPIERLVRWSRRHTVPLLVGSLTIVTLATLSAAFVNRPGLREPSAFPTLLLRDDFTRDSLLGNYWKLHLPVITKVTGCAAPEASVSRGRLQLVNRGCLQLKETLPGGVAIQFDWMWIGEEGLYGDDLTVALRTTGVPRVLWPHEVPDGISVRFSPQFGRVSIMRQPTGEGLAQGAGLTMHPGQWYRVRVTDDGRLIRAYFDDLETPVAEVEAAQTGQHGLALYNREPAGGIDKTSLLDNLELRVPRHVERDSQ